MEISIIALPLIASIISGFFGKFIGDRNSEIITSLMVSISAILSVIVLYEVIQSKPRLTMYRPTACIRPLDWTQLGA